MVTAGRVGLCLLLLSGIACESAAVRCDRRFRTQAGPFTAVGFTSDGKHVVTGGRDGSVGLWNPDSGAPVASAREHAAPVRCLAWSPDGIHWASGSFDRTVRTWKLGSGSKMEPVWKLSGHSDVVSSVAYDAAGNVLASCGTDKSVRLWDMRTGKLIRSWNAPFLLSSVKFGPKAGEVMTADEGGWIRIWDAGNGSERRSFRVHQGLILSMDLSFDGKRIATLARAEPATLSDAETGTLIRTLVFTSGAANAPAIGTAVLFARDSRTVAVGEFSGLTLWNADTGARIGRTGEARGRLAAHPTRAMFASGSEAGELVLCESHE